MPGGYVTKLCSKKLKQSLPPKQELLQKIGVIFGGQGRDLFFLVEKHANQLDIIDMIMD